MEAIIEVNQDTRVFSGNGGNIGNNVPISSIDATSGELDLFPNLVSETENRWEQGDSAIITTTPVDLPAIPDRYKVLDIGGKKVPMSGQWTYRDQQGKFLCYVQRFDASTGQKEFRPLTLSDTGTGVKWQRKAPIEPRPLYGLDRLIARPDAEVMVCEGEKATDAAARLFPERAAVSSMNGAKSPEKSDWSSFFGRTVYLWGDFDEAGEKYIAAVEKLATDAGAKISHVVRPKWFLQMGSELGIEREALPVGWDAADAEQEGFTADNIETFLDQEKNCTAITRYSAAHRASTLQLKKTSRTAITTNGMTKQSPMKKALRRVSCSKILNLL